MNKNDPIKITPCANGFIIEPAYCNQLASKISETIVFHGHCELMDFLAGHFEFPPALNDIFMSKTEGK